MITKIILNPDPELKPCIVTWNEEKEDYTVDVPQGITRDDLMVLVDEIKRVMETGNSKGLDVRCWLLE